MTPNLPKEMVDALHTGNGVVRGIDPNTQRVYVLVDDETHQKAMDALRQREDLEAIQAGIDDLQAGRSLTLEESNRRTTDALARLDQ